VVVRDEGEGIAPEQIDKIFLRFFRLAKNTNQTNGSGLGLAICKVVADSLGAGLWQKIM